MPNHQQPPTIDIGVAAGSIPDIGGGGRAIGQHGPMTTTAASIGHAIDLQTLYAELNSPSSVEDLGSLMRLHVPPPTGGEPLQLRLRPGSVEHDHAASPLRIRIPPLPPTIAGGVQNIGQQQRRRHTPIHYELSANFAAHQAGQLLPHGSSGGGGGGGGDGGDGTALTPRLTTYYRNNLQHLTPSERLATGEERDRDLLDRLFAMAPDPAPSGGLSVAAVAALERCAPEGGCCAICLEDFIKEQHSGADPPRAPEPKPEPKPQVALKLPCGHEFHEACAERWLGSHNTCPVCRHQLARSVGE